MSRTLSEYEYKRLITKSKQGWACFYKAETLNHKLQEENYHMWNELKQKTEENKDIIPSFVLEEMTEMISQLKKSIECPICFTELKSTDIKFSSCGHKFCKDCLSKIDNCAICRKKIYRK